MQDVLTQESGLLEPTKQLDSAKPMAPRSAETDQAMLFLNLNHPLCC